TKAVHVSGKYAYVVSDSTGDDLEIFDVSDPTNPIKVGGVDAAASATNVYVSGKYAYVTSLATDDDLEIFDVSDPTNPFKVGGIGAENHTRGLYVSGTYAYVGSQTGGGDEFEIFDISDPANPIKLGGADTSDHILGIYVSGNYAYVSVSGNAGDELEIFNISDSSNPVKIGGADAGTGNGDPLDIYVSGTYAYIVSSNTGDGLETFDISDPTNPTKVNGIALSSTGNGIYISGKYAYVAGNAFLKIFDIGGFDIPSANIGDLAVGTLDVWENLGVANNVYIDGGLNIGIGGIYTRGPLSVFTASTTAANPISATFMGGNVGIGTTTPVNLLEIIKNGGATTTIGRTDAISVAKEEYGSLVFHGTNSSGQTFDAAAIVGAHDTSTAGNRQGALHFKTSTGAGTLKTKLTITNGGNVFIGDSANANMTQGLTINQGANDDQILAFKSSDVAHGTTDFIGETDTYAEFAKSSGDTGGLTIRALTETTSRALQFVGAQNDGADTGKSTAGTAIIMLSAAQTSGTGRANIVANGNAFAWQAFKGGGDNTIMILDEDGDLHLDGSTSITA
ncbi:MAG: hypothetical protein QF704_10000, partial [Anaerolineales bacterium]|nr:hypothetical protein [Anaerolineales bacterium]